LLKPLSHGTFSASSALLDALNTLVKITGVECVPMLPGLMLQILARLPSPDWTARRAAASLLCTLALRLGPAMSTYKSEVARLLETVRFDKIKSVRDAAAAAHTAVEALDISFSPTKLSLQPDVVGASAVTTAAGNHDLPRSDPSPAAASRISRTPQAAAATTSSSRRTPPPLDRSSAHLETLTATLLTLSQQFEEFRDEVYDRFDKLESRLQSLEQQQQLQQQHSQASSPSAQEPPPPLNQATNH